MSVKKIVIFASGGGSNAEKIMEHFALSSEVQVAKIICNNPSAGVISKAKLFDVPVALISNEDAKNGNVLTTLCSDADLIVLAGYLRKIPSDFIAGLEERIVNLHPSLLPKYGGKGMFGAHVHEAVLANNEKETGITIHYVNENFDEGRIIAQFRTKLTNDDTLSSVQKKIQFLEHSYFPVVIDTVLKSK
ncbi:MAG: phosphoribosylglycinamide formyltransferase [Lishizhenia sp.]